MARTTSYIRKAHPTPIHPAAPLAVSSASTRRRRLKQAEVAVTGAAEPTVQVSLTEPAPAPALAPAAATQHASEAAPASKQARIVAALRRPEGATLVELIQLTGWLAHSVRGVLAGALKRKLGLTIDSRPEEGRGRVYRIIDTEPAEPGPAKVTAMEPEPAATESPRRRAKRRTTDASAAAV